MRRFGDFAQVATDDLRLRGHPELRRIARPPGTSGDKERERALGSDGV